MKNPDELLNKHAKIHMKQWDLKQFKVSYPSLYKVFVGAINEASGNEYIKLQDDDGHWYWIPNDLVDQFNNDLAKISGIDYMDNPDEFDLFTEKYEKYATGGSPDLKPYFYEP